MKRILLVEDDEALGQGIALSFEGQGFDFCSCSRLAEARNALQQGTFDLILLDLGLPDGSGLALCRELRARGDATPVLFLTANDAEYSEVTALEAGGDDYITKPFSLAVLRARVAAALRRGEAKGEAPVYELGPFRFDFSALHFEAAGREITLSVTEQRLLRLLVANRGRTLPREVLLEQVWNGGEFVDENTLTVTVRRLRAKLEAGSKAPAYIQTVYGVGYRWEAGGDV
ncbi:response regulator transcription factor [Allofournierella sp.]|uniref:response regulator transcription factor n=1 Tax=Allofournierella sp. TaxID=1940256 RepID=UPI003AB77147